MKKIVMVAFHYPPLFGSSGIHRTWNFARYLPRYGWEPAVLTASTKAYVNTAGTEPPPEMIVARAFALDTARHLSLRGAYPRWLAVPDRWSTWWPGAVWTGLRLIRRHRPSVIWSTYPIATAHLIALTLHRITGISWVADFRDPMCEVDPKTGTRYPLDPTLHKAYAWIEGQVMRRCARAVFTAHGTAAMYAERYPEVDSSVLMTIPNGYDEEDFAAAEQMPACRREVQPGQLVLLHSGILYPDERDPRVFFAALGELHSTGTIESKSLKIILRASGNEAYFRGLIEANDIGDIVFLEPSLSYREALREMLTADGLLIFQASNCNAQIPAKLYEFMRAGRPILALTDDAGETAKLLREEGIDTVIPLDSKPLIVAGFMAFLARLKAGGAPRANPQTVARHSRESRTGELAALLDALPL